MFKNYFHSYLTNYIPLSKDMKDYIRKITERYKNKDNMQKNSLQLTNTFSNPFLYIFCFLAGYHFRDLAKFIRRP
jgi:hypothetical protein